MVNLGKLTSVLVGQWIQSIPSLMTWGIKIKHYGFGGIGGITDPSPLTLNISDWLLTSDDVGISVEAIGLLCVELGTDLGRNSVITTVTLFTVTCCRWTWLLSTFFSLGRLKRRTWYNITVFSHIKDKPRLILNTYILRIFFLEAFTSLIFPKLFNFLSLLSSLRGLGGGGGMVWATCCATNCGFNLGFLQLTNQQPI